MVEEAPKVNLSRSREQKSRKVRKGKRSKSQIVHPFLAIIELPLDKAIEKLAKRGTSADKIAQFRTRYENRKNYMKS